MLSDRIEQSSARSLVCAAARRTISFAIGPSARASSCSAVRSVSSSHAGAGFCSISVPMLTIVVPSAVVDLDRHLRHLAQRVVERARVLEARRGVLGERLRDQLVDRRRAA